ncbi:hypothetical protein PanWU01x14_221200 [Parasponia andersonii]|uniref:Uncharacterized protein n=1 Tax=Parasponia andersonii TaxID=3476 RepID=A0A2P5BPL1_PARAD|nr:hypothetical protein PanWU01x14_221200 [Parasponia andersonii]
MCVSKMQSEYRGYIENHVITNFAELMERVKKTEITVPETRKKNVQNASKPSDNWDRSAPFKRKGEMAVVDQPNRDQAIPPKIPMDKKNVGSFSATLDRRWRVETLPYRQSTNNRRKVKY